MSHESTREGFKPEYPISRRDLLIQGGAAAFGLAALSIGLPAAAEEKKASKRILFFTKSAGFEHSVIKRQGEELGYAEKILVDLGKQHDFDVVATKDGRIFDGKDFDGFDAIFFYTTGDLTSGDSGDRQPPMSEKGKQRLLDAIASGKGFIGSHCASDSFHTPGDRRKNQEKPDPYIAMVGGEFISHGAQQKATMVVASPKFPGCEHLGKSFSLHEEWYSLKNFAKDLHVILVNDTDGMQGNDYERPPFPATWIRTHGKGRVFYTSMGHREDVWTNPIFQGILLGGINWALKRTEADTTPNIDKVASRASEMPPAAQRKKKGA